MNKKPSINDVAKQAGVSKPIAWAVLNPDKDSNYRYSEETKNKVLAAAEEIGYRPNITAQNFFRRRHGTIGLLVPVIADINSSTLARMLHETSKRGMMLMMEEIPEKRNQVPRMILEDCVDGIILFGTPGYSWYEKLDKLGIPVIEVNTNRRRKPGCITYDEEGACRQAAAFLKKENCRRPLYVYRKMNRNHYSVKARIDSFSEEAVKTGMNTPLIYSADLEPDAADLADFLKTHTGIDSVFLSSTGFAPFLYRGILKAGRGHENTFKVVSFGRDAAAEALLPGLATLVLDFRTLGIKVIERMCARLEGDDPGKSWTVPYELTERDA